MNKIQLFTIGFTKKNANTFFTKLKKAEVNHLIDIRLNNVSQLAGFAKRDDLEYFLRELCDCEYIHLPLLAPTKDILDSYKNKTISWPEYEKRFNDLLVARKAHTLIKLSELHHFLHFPEPLKLHNQVPIIYPVL